MSHHGLAWFPVLDARGMITWEQNPAYQPSDLSIRAARNYPELDLDPGMPIYEQFATKPDSVQWVSEPLRAESLWRAFEM